MRGHLPELVDSTMITAFRGCARKFHNEFLHAKRPPGLSIDLHAGGCFATALETVSRCVWERGMTLSDALVYAQGAFLIEWGDFKIPEHKTSYKTYDRVWEAVERYFEKWSPRTDTIIPYTKQDGTKTFEYTFAIPLEPVSLVRMPGHFPVHPTTKQPFLYGGRFDQLGFHIDNDRPIVRDDKTTKGIGPMWAEQWNLRSQFIGYVWALQQAGILCEDVCIRGIAIQATDIKLVETIKTYSRALVSRWHDQLQNDLWSMVQMNTTDRWEFNLGDQCTQYGSCVFMPSCEAQDPDQWLSMFEERRWNPLLKNPIALPKHKEAA